MPTVEFSPGANAYRAEAPDQMTIPQHDWSAFPPAKAETKNFEFTSPSGRKYSVTGPKSSTAPQAFDVLNQHLKSTNDADFWKGDPLSSEWDQFPRADGERTPVSANNIVRSAATGIPIIGGALNRLEALTNATLAPALNRFFDDKDQLNGDWSQRYADSLAQQQGMDRKFEAENPNIDAASKIAGGVASTLPVAATTTGAKLLGLTGSTLPRQIGAGIASGTAIGGTDAAVRGDDPTRGAITGGAFGAAGPLVGRAANRIVESFRPSVAGAELPTAEGIKEAAEKGFDQLRNLPGKIKPESVNGIGTQIEQKLNEQGFRQYLTPKVYGVISEMTKEAPEGAYASFGDLHGIRRALGQAAGSADPSERAAAMTAKSMFDDYLGAIPRSDLLDGNAQIAAQILKRANANFSAAKSSDTLQGKIDAAEQNAAASHSGMNTENNLRQRINDILKSKTLRRGFTQDEILQMQRVVRGTAPANVLRVVGNMLGGNGGLTSLASSTLGSMATGSPVGFVAPAAGAAIKKIGTRMTEHQLERLDEMIRARAPASESANAVRQALDERRAQRVLTAGQVGAMLSRGSAPAFAGQNAQ